jgi:signal transduction histidine kinase
MKVLIADDDVHNRRLLELMLSQEGYEVTCVEDGSKALEELAKPDAPRLVILDWMMPVMDGITTCRKIRERKQTEYIYIILLTAKINKDDIVTGLEAGADDYVAKPFHAQELAVRLRAGARIIELQNDVLERSKMIEEFVYAVSHDMRTPLIAMQLTMSQAREGLFGDLPEAYGGVLGKTVLSVQELLRLADTLLTAGQYENDAVPDLPFEQVDLVELADECVSELEPIWMSREQRMEVMRPSFSGIVMGERPNLRRVLINLLSNATKFAPSQGTIQVLFERAGDKVVSVSVWNDGPTMSDEEQSRLFKRFASGRRKSVGVGLGLYLCKRIVERHGGVIEYVPGEAVGGRFRFSLPVQARKK